MTECKKIELGANAHDFVRGSLENGGTLAHELLRVKELGRGHVWTMLPNDLEIEDIRDFASGILPEPPEENQYHYEAANGLSWRQTPVLDIDDCLVPIIQSFLHGDERRICILENAVAMPSDFKAVHTDLPILVFGDDVYQFVVSGAETVDLIGETIKKARTWLLNGVLSVLPEHLELFADITVVTREQIGLLAASTSQVVVGAFDGEGFLIWDES